MLTNKMFGLKEQVASVQALKDAGVFEAAENLYHSFNTKQDNISEYLLQLKKDDSEGEFETFFRDNASYKEIWDSPVFEDIIVPLVKYLYKRKFEYGHEPLGTIQIREFPSGLLKFGSESYSKNEPRVIYTLKDLSAETIGDFRYHPGKNHRFVFTEDGVWYLSNGVSSFVPFSVFTKLKSEHLDLIGKEISFSGLKTGGRETNAPMEEIKALQDLFNQRNADNKLENLDAKLLLANLNIPAQASAETDEEYPIFHELKIKGVQYPVASLSLFSGVNSLQSKETFTAYHSPLHIILEADNGAFSIVKVQATGIAYSNLVLGTFTKGLTIREAERIEAALPSTIEVPAELLERKAQLRESLDRQKLLTEDIYEGIIRIAQQYISSYTQKVMVKRGKIEVEVVRGLVSPENINDYNYVHEVDEIFWQYNNEITIEELLAYFITKGKDEAYQLLCLKILGIDYMYHYNELVDALISTTPPLLMIEHIRVDAETKTLKELKYNYLHLYASGKIYEKLEQLKDNQNHIINYYGEKTGLNIVSQQEDILNQMTPTSCSLVAVDKDRQLELDWSNNIFWEPGFPALNVKGKRDAKTIRKLFEDFLPSVEIYGGISVDMIRDGYMYSLTQKDFIGGYDENGKPHGYILPGWEHDGKKVKIESPSMLDILIGIFPKRQRMVPKINRKTKQPVLDTKGNQVMIPMKIGTKDFTAEQRAEGRVIYNAIRTKYFSEITAVKVEGSRLFNMFLRNELTGASQEIIASRWNEKFNGFQSPKSEKMPVFMRLARYFGTDVSKLFELNPVQLQGVKFTSARDNNALIAHEVGLGKSAYALATISHLFETGTLQRVLLMTPTRVYDKFLKEAQGKDNFRGLIPHIKIVELENAKPNKFEPIVNEKTGEIIKNKLKKYTADEYKVYKMYKGFISDIDRQIENDFIKFPNKRLEVNQATIDTLDATLTNYIPAYRSHQFFANMMDEFIAGKAGYEALINQKIALIEERDKKQNIVTEEEDREAVRIKYGKLFSSDVMLDLKAMKNKILDELGYYFPENLQPKTIVMATHIALQELRPSAASVEKAIHIVDDTDDYDEARDKTKEWLRTIGNQAVSFDKLKIDGIIIDEAHNFNELVSHIRPRYIKRVGGEQADDYAYEKLQVGHGDSIGKHLFRYWYKIGETDARKITALSITQEVKSRIMLSATPFTEGPLHAYSMMNLVNSKRLEEMNMESSYNFFENFIFEVWKIDTKQDRTGLFASVEKYRNGAALCNFMSALADFKMGGEDMRSVRPDKFIIPDEEQVLNGVTSYIPHNPAQEYLKERISDYLNGKIQKKEDICNEIEQEEDLEMFEIYDKNDKNYNKWVATEQQIIDYLEQQKASIPKYKEGDAWEKNLKRHGLAAREVELDGNGNIQGLIKGGNASKAFLKEARVWQAASMQSQINISPYFIGCSPPGNLLPSLEEVMKDGQGNPILIDGLPISMTAENFVVNSPKIWYAVECIKSVLEQHKERGEAPSGQIIYMNMGKSFKFDGLVYDDSGKYRNRGSAFTLIKRYIANRPDIDLDEDEIGIIHAGIGDEATEQVIKDFNNGKVKVLIGSSTIREGIDLQMNSSVMYILQSEFNPTNAIQLEGRIWRQGNRWLNVRMVYVLSYNSSDIFVYSKVKGKINSIREIMRAGRCDMNETHIFSLNPEEIQMALNTNSLEKAKMWWQGEERKIRLVIDRLDRERGLLKDVKKEYPKVKEKYIDFIDKLNVLGKVVQEVKLRDLVDRVVQELRITEKQKTRAELEKDAQQLIAIGKYTLTEKEAHRDFTENMVHSDFIERLNYIRTNYRKVDNYHKIGKREELKKQGLLELGDLTQQEIYWRAIILAGFENYSDFYNISEKFLTGRPYDRILAAYNTLIVAGKKQFADIDDIVEGIEKETRAISKRIEKSSVEIEAQKLVYDMETEKKKKAGAFSIELQRDAFISTNYLLVPRNP